ncbi:arylamine N-acetyltransferase, pineal gland isozyme NAT-3-like [Megalops cyprinoides]|uniref:arylamine N-acetyltransferase, pineal gland isozyme NAT-3-like n=1 Tax=Megalops cyprinoides TaxID=118141 RepID=UPI0018650CA6|nr:arylamine N-acetyltransferase, pineal gland isozyme NAT-3-like [Megalops cyprinoides]
MDVAKYLLRIGCSGPMMPTLATLQHVHHRHLLSVPFENLTIHSGGQVGLELPLLYDKIIHQHRGGFCFENNGLFSWLLSQLGFEVTLLSAQVKNRITGVYGPPFDHMIIMVTLEGHRWLCDVGFGAGFEVPMSLETEEPQKQGHGVFRIRHEGEILFLETAEEDLGETDSQGLLACRGDGIEMNLENSCRGWTELYKFTLQARQREDFKAMCHYHQSSQSSVFYCKSLCSLLLPNGRVSYMGRKLIVTSIPTEGGGRTTKHTQDLTDKEIPGILRERFGIVLNSAIYPKDEDIVPPAGIY